MSLLDKFGDERGEEHPGPLTFPGSGLGLPILGRVASNLRQEEFEEIDHKFVYKTREYRSWVEGDMDAYRRVQERASNITDGGVTWYAIRQYERIRDPGGRGWLIWLEWIQAYGIVPAHMRESGGPDAVKEFVQKNSEAEFLAGGSVEVYRGVDSWEQVTPPDPPPVPSGARGYFDPFAPRRNGRG
jgi:hypothetical protein